VRFSTTRPPNARTCSRGRHPGPAASLVAQLQPDIVDEEFEPTIDIGGAPASTAQYYLSWTDGGARRFPDSYPLSFNHRQVLLEHTGRCQGNFLRKLLVGSL
jgi:hypothetical protein